MTARTAGLLLALLLVIAAPAPALAQPASGTADSEYLRGRFTQQRFLKGFAAPLASEGRFVLVPRQGLLWLAEKPFAITTLISPAGLVQDVRGTETLRLSASRLPAVARLYAMLGGALSGDWTALEDGFSVDRQVEGEAWRLHLTPRRGNDPAMPFRQIVIAGTRFVESVEIIKPDGDRDLLTFHDQRLHGDPMSADEQHKFAALTRP